MDTIRFFLPPPELSCLIGNLFTELEPPCGAGQLDQDGITLYGRTASGERGGTAYFPGSLYIHGPPGRLPGGPFRSLPGKGLQWQNLSWAIRPLNYTATRYR